MMDGSYTDTYLSSDRYLHFHLLQLGTPLPLHEEEEKKVQHPIGQSVGQQRVHHLLLQPSPSPSPHRTVP